MLLPEFLAVRIAASFIMFSMSAPVKPGVLLAKTDISTFGERGLPLEWTLIISSLPLTSGIPTTIRLSKRPGRKSAGSKMSGLFVAATSMMPSFTEKPSISTNSWLSVCSRSSWPPPSPAPRWRPTASISSINIIQGELFFAWSKRSLTREAPTPTNISTKSEPLILKNGTPASPATALASKVFPVPGGPTSKTPFGIRAPSWIYFLGFFKKSTISFSSSFSSSAPATSLKVIRFFSSLYSLALLLPNDMTLFPPPWACCMNTNQKTPKRTKSITKGKIPTHQGASAGGWGSHSKLNSADVTCSGGLPSLLPSIALTSCINASCEGKNDWKSYLRGKYASFGEPFLTPITVLSTVLILEILPCSISRSNCGYGILSSSFCTSSMVTARIITTNRRR